MRLILSYNIFFARIRSLSKLLSKPIQQELDDAKQTEWFSSYK